MAFWQSRSNFFFLLISYALLILADATDLPACTLWAAAGKRVAHGGCLIATNRDWSPEPDEVHSVRPPTGFRYLGLFPIRNGTRKGVVAGVNEKGLVVVAASASSIPGEEREEGGKGVTHQLLSVFSTVDLVLENKALFSRTHPSIYLIADRSQAAWIEVAPGERYAIRNIKSGILAHTNHYLDGTLFDANVKIGSSSRTRLARVVSLLNSRTAPLTLEDFIVFSQDRSDGPDDSLWRTGGSPAGERTLASWIVSLPPKAPPELFVRLANPGEPERTMRMTLDTSW
jgi:isopenicillin-N N-acyltransferase like protein